MVLLLIPCLVDDNLPIKKNNTQKPYEFDEGIKANNYTIAICIISFTIKLNKTRP